MKSSGLLLCAICLYAGLATAQEQKRSFDGSVEDKYSYGAEEEEEGVAPWKEGAVQLPGYPVESDLVDLQVDAVTARYRYQLDTKALTVGSDGVIRYTVVIQSGRGKPNVIHEGIRCASKRYKVYAYGSSDGSFKSVKKPRWKTVIGRGTMSYRMDLLQFYLCDDQASAREPSKVLEYVAYPSRLQR